ncbi:magnesium-translocating P-type ATPase [Listeria ivanovii]|uniref:Magnesium-transporting ATPase, P-type 1 n=1 Tax=Listeria ivanovii (strain ATCC BAA-678 / PAM 55) TaxID=881621 RepID=G2ZCB0_LISIP|nr:magnesium-translocating P-type ATPase [Listeria ivanovii]AHI57118.1 haloacid dehalogenase [Listeria ivanovii WSLC3009]AIS66535.1 magnesium ABC transporter ATPase [Listeria ivanovii subsp. ivanovii]MBC1760561.1 magnesium-translocating P-type ATPase [Listeria ivanovii]MCJ1717832.1 magnesium-translocating P-type ATPase [Listeria ivanovii]MCJ1723031.1 magnesium-translocating P-type ATPase [Listeria ivanovii]
MKKQQVKMDSKKMLKESQMSKEEILEEVGVMDSGLTRVEVAIRQAEFGRNQTVEEQKVSQLRLFVRAFNNPFIYILVLLMVISYLTADMEATIIMAIMIFTSGLLGFIQSSRAERASYALKNMVKNKVNVLRDGKMTVVTQDEVVPGDVIEISVGDIIPADARVISATDLLINQSALTGESIPTEKYVDDKRATPEIFERENLLFMGTDVLSGHGRAVILRTGSATFFGSLSIAATEKRGDTSFDKGVKTISKLLFYFMLVMVPIVFLINGLMKGNWLEAFLYAVAIAVGLTPEMLPMIVSTNLAKGAINMSSEKVIMKELSAIQNIGAMDILCTDKTGTLTEDKLELVTYIDSQGGKSTKVLEMAYLNSYFQTGWKNVLDQAIMTRLSKKVANGWNKIGEIPFNFDRRRLSVIVENNLETRIITKGAVEEMLTVCTHKDIDGAISALTKQEKKELQEMCAEMNRSGIRVIGVAYKSQKTGEAFTKEDEENMIIAGFLGFRDPVKSSTKEAITSLFKNKINVKVLTGDNEIVTKRICQEVGIPANGFLLGTEVDELMDEELMQALRKYHIFAKLTPMQKSRIIELLKEAGHTVGFLGDGVNDAPALRKADVGISVDTAADITKDASSVILLEKSLTVLNDAVMEGRNVFGNILKYIKMTASSNFGNVFSVLIASAFIPFLPMLSLHLLLQNLLYDSSQLTLPWDKMDRSFLKKPHAWEQKGMLRFILCIGPVSSIFDIATFLIMWFVFSANTMAEQALFHSGWFVVGLLTQTLVVHMIRTEKIPFIQSRATAPVMISTLIVMSLGLIIPFTGFGHSIGFVSLPGSYFPWLVLVLVGYMATMQVVKMLYIRKFREWI